MLSASGNTISGVMLGISVGVSHAASAAWTKYKQRTPDHISLVDQIAGKTALCRANDVASAQARFGVFVGNADSVEVEGNRLDVTTARGRAARPAAATVSWWSSGLGPRMIVRGNYTSGFITGIRVMPLVGNGPGQRALGTGEVEYTQGVRTTGSLWLVADNDVVAGAAAHPPPGPFEPTNNLMAWLNPYIDAWACLLVDNVAHP